jgi:hypothetical protein
MRDERAKMRRIVIAEHPIEKVQPRTRQTRKRDGFFTAAGGVLVFMSGCLGPPACPRVDGGPRLGGKSRREERLRPWIGVYGMRRRDRRATA